MSALDLTLEPETRTVRRLEVITGAGGRRRWSDDDKARIVEETLLPGANVSAVARRHDLSPQQVFAWRREARYRSGHAIERKRAAAPAFAPVVVAAEPAPVQAAVIEVVIGEAVVRVPPGTDAATLRTVLRVVKAAS